MLKLFEDASTFFHENEAPLSPAKERIKNFLKTITDEENQFLNEEITDEGFKNIDSTLPYTNTDELNSTSQIKILKAQTSLNFNIQIPSKFNDYEVINFIGKGSFSVVALVKMISTQQIFAAKIVSKEEMLLLNEMDSIEKEVDFLSSFNHPNILKYYDFFPIQCEKNEYFSIITDYYEGNLAAYIQNGKIQFLNLKKILYKIAKAVGYLHSKGIAHLDIKPDNILIDSNSNLALCDFGFSTSDEFSISTKCTPRYAAPELVQQNGPYKPIVADIWSLGVTFFAISMKKFPYNTSETLTNEKLQRKLSIIKNQKLQNLIRKCLQINPEQRATINEILHDEYFSATSNFRKPL